MPVEDIKGSGNPWTLKETGFKITVKKAPYQAALFLIGQTC